MDFDPNSLPLGEDSLDPFGLNQHRKRLDDILNSVNNPQSDFHIGLRGLNFHHPMGTGMFNGNVGFNGNYNLNAQYPLMGGLLSLGVNGSTDQSPEYKLGYRLKF